MPSSDIHPSFALFHRTIQHSSESSNAVIGMFDPTSKGQQIVRATNTAIELWTFKKSNATFTKQITQDTYSQIRKISTFKLVGSKTDNLVIVSDSGNISICHLDLTLKKFVNICIEPFFKSGIRRISPGEYLAIDNKSRAICIGAIEQNKTIYTLNTDFKSGATSLTSDISKLNKAILSSPLESNRSQLLTFDLVSLDVNFENPLFAAIETDYSMEDSKNCKLLNYYEMDLGLNNVTRKGSDKLQSSANHLIQVPGGSNGPSGVLVCSSGVIEYKYPNSANIHKVNIPQRSGQTEPSIIITSVIHQMKKEFFILAQNQFGDIFKLSIEFSQPQDNGIKISPGNVESIKIRYFDSIPICQQLLIFKSGFLYANCENGDQYIYQFEKLGDGPEEEEWSSLDYSTGNDNLPIIQPKNFDNLNLVNIIESLNPMMGLNVDFNSNDLTSIPKLLAFTGTQARSTIKFLTNEVNFSSLAKQQLPRNPTNIWNIKQSSTSKFDDMAVISFDSSTMILKLGDEIEEADEEQTQLYHNLKSLLVCNIFDFLVQVTPNKFKWIKYSDSEEENVVKSKTWEAPYGLEILTAANTHSQLVISLSNGELIYFEIENNEITERKRKDYIFQITSLTFSSIYKGSNLAKYIIVGTKDKKIELLSTETNKLMDVIIEEEMSGVPTSLCVTLNNIDKSDSVEGEDEDETNEKNTGLSINRTIEHLHIGFDSGLYARVVIKDGEFTQASKKYIGPKTIQLKKLKMSGEYVSIHCIRTWLSYPTVELKLRPLLKPEDVSEEDSDEEEEEEDQTDGEKIEEDVNEEQELESGFTSIATIHTDNIKQGLLLIHDKQLIISNEPDFKKETSIESVPLRYTPRSIVRASNKEINEESMVYVACSDMVSSPFIEGFSSTGGVFGGEEESSDNLEEIFEECQQWGYQKSDAWSSCIHVISPSQQGIGQTIEFKNESAQKIAIATMQKDQLINEYLFVSTINNFQVLPRKFDGCFIKVYRILEDGSLEYVYSHPMESPVLAMTNFQDKLLLGWGKEIGLFELGKKQLIRKSGFKYDLNVTQIVSLNTKGNTVIVSDGRDSINALIYKPLINQFLPVADDFVPRSITRTILLDYETILTADKYGSLTVLKIPESAELGHADRDGSLLKIMSSAHNGNIGKFSQLAGFHVGDIVTSFSMFNECVIYGGLSGVIGSLLPMKSIREVNFFNALEKLIWNARSENRLDLSGREGFRRGVGIRKGCVDGDLIVEFKSLSLTCKKSIATQLEKDLEEIESKIDEMLNRVGL
ncbi:U2 snRNP complex subunit [Martiniozyma asiatica (nom. inval.)]|nr:U2 snRNP complex subunit [Martiniozyma asiatica]